MGKHKQVQSTSHYFVFLLTEEELIWSEIAPSFESDEQTHQQIQTSKYLSHLLPSVWTLCPCCLKV